MCEDDCTLRDAVLLSVVYRTPRCLFKTVWNEVIIIIVINTPSDDAIKHQLHSTCRSDT